MSATNSTDPLADLQAAADNLAELVRQHVPAGPERDRALELVRAAARCAALGLGVVE